jgi:hypothetical protein
MCAHVCACMCTCMCACMYVCAWVSTDGPAEEKDASMWVTHRHPSSSSSSSSSCLFSQACEQVRLTKLAEEDKGWVRLGLLDRPVEAALHHLRRWKPPESARVPERRKHPFTASPWHGSPGRTGATPPGQSVAREGRIASSSL